MTAGDHGVKQSRAVHMNLQVIRMRPTADSFQRRQRIISAATEIRRVLHANQPGSGQVLIVGANLAFKVGNVEHPVFALERSAGHPA
jgi:hypothetical protein